VTAAGVAGNVTPIYAPSDQVNLVALLCLGDSQHLLGDIASWQAISPIAIDVTVPWSACFTLALVPIITLNTYFVRTESTQSLT